MIEGDFDKWTLANMNAALDRACEQIPHGEEHAVRKRIAKQIIRCAKSGKTTLSELTAAGQRALIGNIPTSQRESKSPHGEERVGVYHRAALRADPLARLEP